jgi:UrcA family protein
VLYSDLNLKNPADAERLMTRIDHIAQDACKYLDRLYPLSADPECFQKSVGKA